MTDVSLSALGGAGWQFLDNSGRILSAGRLYTYEAGGSTEAETYTDHTGNTSNGVYVQLDSAGRPPAEIWQETGVNLKYVLKSSTGALIRTYDYIPSITSTAILATNAGASMIGTSWGETVEEVISGQPLTKTTNWYPDVGPGDEPQYAARYVLADPDGTYAATATPQIGFFAAIQSVNAVNGWTGRAGEFIAENNCATGGAQVPIWGIYGETRRKTANTLNSYGIEWATLNYVAEVTGWNPYSQSGSGTIGLLLQSGGGLSASGQYDNTAALQIQKNPMQWGTGILFDPDTVSATGIGGSIPAICLPYDHEIQWVNDATHLNGRLRGDSTGNMFFDLPKTGAFYVNGFVSTGISVTKTTDFALDVTESAVACNGSGTITATLPTASSNPGRHFMIKTITNNAVISASANVAPINSGVLGTAILAATAGKWAMLWSDGFNWQIMAAN